MGRLFLSQSKYNFGQLNILCDIFRDNKELAILVSNENLEYFMGLIMKHGHHEEFLKVLEVLLNSSSNQLPSDVYTKIIKTLLPNANFELICVRIMIFNIKNF